MRNGSWCGYILITMLKLMGIITRFSIASLNNKLSYLGERTNNPAKGCRILRKGQTIQRKVDVSWGKDKQSSERMLYPGERTNNPAKGRRILGKGQSIQRKDAVSWRKNELSSERMLYPGERTNNPAKG